MTAMNLYWFLKLDAIRNILDEFGITFLIFGIMALIAIIILRIIWKTNEVAEWEIDCDNAKLCYNFYKFLKPIAIFLLIFGSLFTIGSQLIPSTKEMAVIYVVPKVINNEKVVQKIPNKILDLANDWLDKQIGNIDSIKVVE